MKVEKTLKVVLIILIIILLSLISFGGIYVQKMKFVENIIPEYSLGMDLEGSRTISLEIDTSTNKVIYDKDGKVVEKEGEGTTTKEEPVNPENMRTKENYLNAKKIMEKRMKLMGVTDYTVRFNEATGRTTLQIPENNNTDLVVQYIRMKGDFSVVNDAGDVLLTKADVKKSQVGYRTTTTGTSVYLTITLTDEGKEKLKEISKTYVKTTNEEGKEETKKITIKIDDATLASTHFEEEISNGVIQLSIGQASTTGSDINQYIREASNLSVLINTGTLPLTYTLEENRYIQSEIEKEDMLVPAIVILAIIIVACIILIIKYKKYGFISVLCLIGYIATLLLTIRYTNVILTVEGIIGVLVAIVLNYIFNIYLLSLLKENAENKTREEASKDFWKTCKKAIWVFIPALITSVVLCFAGWLPIFSFGMVVFWGLLIMTLYNVIITRSFVVNASKK